MAAQMDRQARNSVIGRHQLAAFAGVSLCLLLLARARAHPQVQPAQAQQHFRPVQPVGPQQRASLSNLSLKQQALGQQRRQQQAPELANPKFLAALNERALLAKLVQQQQQRHEFQHAGRVRPLLRQTKSLADRRASSSSAWSPNQVLVSGQQVKFAQAVEQPQQQWRQQTSSQTANQQTSKPGEQASKMLICYYTTRQTAPYWPKEAREFVVPPEQLANMLAHNLQPIGGSAGPSMNMQRASSVNVGTFNDRYPNYQQAARYPGGARRQMVLVAPEFTPAFAAPPNQTNPGALTQLFFASAASGNQPHSMLTSRQDNWSAAASGLVRAGHPASVAPPLPFVENNGAPSEQRAATSAYNLVTSGSPPPPSMSPPPPHWPANNGESNAHMARSSFGPPTPTTSVPMVPDGGGGVTEPVMSNNYLYYFNQQPTASSASSAAATSASAATSTTNALATSQRAKSLQAAESELAPAALQMAPVGPQAAGFTPALRVSPSTGAGDFQLSSVVSPHEQLVVKFPSSSRSPNLSESAGGGEHKATTLSSSGTSSAPTTSLLVGAARQSLPRLTTGDEQLLLSRQNQVATVASSPTPPHSTSAFSTMFDVFGAASQYLMRFKPSALISPSAFASPFERAPALTGASSTAGALLQSRHHNYKTNASSLFGSSPFISLPNFSTAGNGQPKSSEHALERQANSSAAHKSDGFLSRLTLHGTASNANNQQQQRREDICGRTIQTPERRIIGGEGARYGEFPYQVHIKIAKHQCGGALVDKQSIVTAAHCVYHFITRAPVSKLQIVIGAYDIEDEQYQELPPQYFKVNKVKLHPNFRFSASHPDRYDVAILKLDKPVKYTDNVLPVCLPSKELKFENLVGTVTGFGKTDPSLSNRYGTRLLQKVDVPIIENKECERWHRTRGIDLKIFPEMMCAGYEDGLKDACVGDSGGPLVVKTPVGTNGSFRWTLAGITSAGFGCAQSRQPGIYHRVSHTVDWILENLD